MSYNMNLQILFNRQLADLQRIIKTTCCICAARSFYNKLTIRTLSATLFSG